jgi:hypothetical protein
VVFIVVAIFFETKIFCVVDLKFENRFKMKADHCQTEASKFQIFDWSWVFTTMMTMMVFFFF